MLDFLCERVTINFINGIPTRFQDFFPRPTTHLTLTKETKYGLCWGTMFSFYNQIDKKIMDRIHLY